MLVKCANCGKQMLTECDIFVYQQRESGDYYSCGCIEFKKAQPFQPPFQGDSPVFKIRLEPDETTYSAWAEEFPHLRFQAKNPLDALKGIRSIILGVTTALEGDQPITKQACYTETP